ncbi:DUF362 domain-containing protein [Calderihabitans maritimus]|uniref:DUF362 domain-containing protein n=1 Tax=Calderihabitans maritimus TaxID=1246530 RepID=A0A1Z5HND8_9FIRM|nr:DUF362 domain-containing protein [Calderihabitans maritimus]GAW90968.1 hypothetical protein KKC1_01300 [Calderihabitans maritimus]
MSVALTKVNHILESLRRVIELCQGFKGLKPNDKILLKPNMVMRGRRNQPPHGQVTSVTVVEGMISLLREAGCSKIEIADGGVIHPELRLNTFTAYEWAGYVEMAERLNVPLIDLNEGPFVMVDLEGLKVQIARRVLDADFVINLPVLKTHHQTQVSLGLKNLKGILSFKSKKDFHGYGLERMIALLGTKVKVDLTVIDGTFAMQKGPVGEDVHRTDLLVAGKDILQVDIVGSRLLGIEPEQVGHLRIFAELTDRSLTVEPGEIRGEKVEELRKPLEWVDRWPRDLMQRYNISGIRMEDPGVSICSGCGFGIFAALNKFFRENAGANFQGIEICMGRETIASPEASKVFCLGKCACDANRKHPNAVLIRGCPPSVQKMYECFKKELTPAHA